MAKIKGYMRIRRVIDTVGRTFLKITLVLSRGLVRAMEDDALVGYVVRVGHREDVYRSISEPSESYA